MNTYVERNPVTLQAIQFTGEVTEELTSRGFLAPNSFQLQMQCPLCRKSLANHALKGVGESFQPICPGSYIIFDSTGAFQVMSSQNFEKLYRLKWKRVEDAVFTEIAEEISKE